MDEYNADPLAVNRRVVEQYRANDGQVEGFGGPSRLLLLTTKGARSGEERTAPMMYLRDGDRLVVYAANAGSPRHPAWYRNVVAHPDVTVQVGGDRFEATAVVTSGEERERLWRMFPFPQFEEQAGREVPVIVLERRPG
jgi:deazaflavin-dependent oxidoreductase (nitroreductase family)